MMTAKGSDQPRVTYTKREQLGGRRVTTNGWRVEDVNGLSLNTLYM